MYNKVDDFLAKMAAQTAPMSRNENKQKGRVLEKISLNFPGNFGRYQVLPMDDVVTEYPYVVLNNTREICIPRKNIAADGTENVYNAWIKILPAEGYKMKDMTGRVVSSLTAEEEQLLREAQAIFDQLFEELDVRNNVNMSKELLRKRNYTLFHAMCLNKWDFDDTRTPKKNNFCGLFVCTAKSFVQTVEDNIKERSIMSGGDSSWITSVYNNQLTGRDGFLMFSISRSKDKPGYAVTATHEYGRASMLQGVSIPEEDAELMKSPIATFLGWQAAKSEDSVPIDQRRYFNAALIKEAISFMTSQLAGIRMAKQSGTDVLEAIKVTNENALKNQVPTNSQGKATNDPVLAKMATQSQEPQVNVQNVVEGNTDPFHNPPVSHIDPVTGAPTPSFGGGSGFSRPSFGGNSGLPF